MRDRPMGKWVDGCTIEFEKREKGNRKASRAIKMKKAVTKELYIVIV